MVGGVVLFVDEAETVVDPIVRGNLVPAPASIALVPSPAFIALAGG
jgi:hypothetical protein